MLSVQEYWTLKFEISLAVFIFRQVKIHSLLITLLKNETFFIKERQIYILSAHLSYGICCHVSFGGRMKHEASSIINKIKTKISEGFKDELFLNFTQFLVFL